MQKRSFLQWGLGVSGFALSYVQDKDKAYLESVFPGKFSFALADGDSEYIYDTEEMLSLEGKKYQKLRRKLNSVYSRYSQRTIRKAELDDRADILTLFRAWSSEHHVADTLTAAETLFEGWRELGLDGVVMFCGDVLCGAALGTYIDDQTFNTQIINSEISNGCYLLIYELNKALAGKVKYNNFEEDLDIPGLRMMKKHLNPSAVVQMWNATVKQ